MSFGLLMIVVAIATVSSIVVVVKSIRHDEAVIEKTKIITTTRHSTGGLRSRTYTMTTFMVYYKDGTKKAVTVSPGTFAYNTYMSKLDI
ncbi:MAG: hypothetical protein Q4E18_02835 [Clostridia bacterium]|nr:hypothetical protein [Clostridia bacterium]